MTELWRKLKDREQGITPALDPAVKERILKRREARANPMSVKYGIVDDPDASHKQEYFNRAKTLPKGPDLYWKPDLNNDIDFGTQMERQDSGRKVDIIEDQKDKFSRAGSEGWGNSMAGMISRGVITQEQSQDFAWYHSVFKEIVTFTADAPVTVGVGVGAGVLTGGNPVAAYAASGAAESFIRAFIIDRLKHSDEDPHTIVQSLHASLTEGYKGAITGAVTGKAGKLVRGLTGKYGNVVSEAVAVPTEGALAVVVDSLMHDQKINAESFRQAGITILSGQIASRTGAHLKGKTIERQLMKSDNVANKMMDIETLTGLHRDKVVEMAKTDNRLRRQLLSDDPGIPEALVNDKVRSKIQKMNEEPESADLGDTVKQVARDAEIAYIDDGAYLKHIMGDENPDVVRPWDQDTGADNPYMGLINSRGYQSKVNQWNEKGGFSLVDLKPTGSKGYHEILKSVNNPDKNMSHDGFAEHLTSRTAKEREKHFFADRRKQRKVVRELEGELKILGSKSTKRQRSVKKKLSEAKKVYAEMRPKRDNDAYTGLKGKDIEGSIERGTEKYAEAAKDYYTMMDDLLRVRKESGLSSQSDLDNIMDRNIEYSPMKRVLDGNGEHKVDSKGNKLYTFGGSDKMMANPLNETGKMIQDTILAAERNIWINNLNKQFGHNPDIIQQIPGKVERSNAKRDGLEVPEFKATENNDGSMSLNAYVDGKLVTYKVSKGLFEVAQVWGDGSIGKTEQNIVQKTAKLAASTLRIGATSEPTFMVKNAVKDTMTGALMSDQGGNALKKFGDGLKSSLTGDDYRVLGKMAGADYAGRTNRESLALDKIITEHPQDYFFNNVLDPTKLVKMVVDAGKHMESGVRQGEFNKTIDNGGSPQAAAYNYRKITGDFTRAGTQGRKINQYSAFWNMRIQGMARTIESAKADPVGFTAKTVAYVAAPTLALELGYTGMLNGTFDEPMLALGYEQEHIDAVKEATEMVKQLDVSERYMNFHFPYATQVIAKDQYGVEITKWEPRISRMVKTHDVGMVGSDMTRRMYDHAVNEDPRAFEGMLEKYNTEYGTGVLLGTIPTVVEPMFGWNMNHDSFRGKEIVSPWHEDASAQYQYNDGTNELSKRISMMLSNTPLDQVGLTPSPQNLDYLISSYTAGLGKLAMTVSNKVLKGLDGEKNLDPEDPQGTWTTEWPLVRAFFVRRPGLNSKVIKDFEKRYEKFQTLEKDAQLALSRGDYELHESIMTDPRYIDLGKMYQMMKTLKTDAYKFHGWDASYYADGTPAEFIRKDKRSMIEENVKNAIQVATDGMALYDEYDAEYKQLKKDSNDGI